MNNRPNVLPFVINAVAGAAGGALGLAWYLSERINPVPNQTYADRYTFTPWELGADSESITLHTPDNLKLSGWWLPQPASQSVIIGCHGHIGNKSDLLGIGARLWNAGHNVLLFDFRGRGESDSWPNTLASRELDDLRVAIAYARERMPDARLGIIGYSMGAAIALLVAANEPSIAAIVADSAFTTAADAIAHGIRQVFPIPVNPLLLLTDAVIERRHGYRIRAIRPVDSIGQIAPRPLLFIHGANDSVVPPEHAQQLFAVARHPKELWMCEDADHCGAYFVDRNAYVERVNAFFAQYLTSVEL